MNRILLVGIIGLSQAAASGCVDRGLTTASRAAERVPEILSEGPVTSYLEGRNPQPRSGIHPIELDTTEENAFTCSAVSPGQQGAIRGKVTMPRARSTTGAATRQLGRFRYVRWDRTSKKKELEISCVVPLTEEGGDQAKTFARRLDLVMVPSSDTSGLASIRVLDGPSSPEWNGDDIDCYWWQGSPGQVTCEGGVVCEEWALLRAEFDQYANLNVYTCPNGCEVYRHPWAYWCPSAGGDVSYEDDWSSGGSGGSSGGGGTNGPPGYCPSVDPACLKDMTAAQQAVVDSALNVTVDRNRDVCRTAMDSVVALRARGRVYRGNPDIPDIPGDTTGRSTHDGQASERGGPEAFIHIDTHVFNDVFGGVRTLRDLAAILLHEGWHIAGYNHPENESFPYVTPPFTEMVSCANQTNH